MIKEVNSLPESWTLTTIGQIGIIVSGGTPSTQQPKFWGGDIPWITPADLSNYKDKYIRQGHRNISKLGLENSSVKLLPKGSVLFSSRAPIGYTVIAQNEITTNQGFKNLILTHSSYSDYIYYYLQSSKQLAESFASGTTFLELSATKFSQIPFPLPPLAEQHRIVEKIEELFSELDKAQESLSNAQKQLETYRQVVLKDAFEGKLTNKTKFELINKREVIFDEIWKWYRVDEVAHISMGQSPSGDSYHYIENGVPLINGPSEFSPNPFSKTLMKKWTTKPTKMCEKGDLILCVRGSTTGRLNIAGFDACIGRGVASIKGHKIPTLYLAYFFHYSEQKIYNMGTGSTFPNINKEQIASFLIPFSFREEAHQVIQEIEYRFALIDNLENSINENLKKVEIFRHTILQKAFSGKLVPQYETDEPASELLKQIIEEIIVYQNLQKEIAKSKPRKLVFMESNKTVKEILEEADGKPMDAKEVWQNSIHKNDIEKFYEELKQLSESIDVSFDGITSKLLLKK